MPLLNVNATSTGLKVHQTSQRAEHACLGLAHHEGPSVFMVHGYKYAPGSQRHCPHTKIFRAGAGGWPHGLGFHGQDPKEGLGIAFGWHARGLLGHAHRRANELGADLAALVRLLRVAAPHKPIHLVAHSLGSEIVLSALGHLQEGSVDRIILLTGASHQGHARRMLQSPAGQTAQVLNVTSRENDLFDAAFEWLVPSRVSDHGAIGRGLEAPNVVNLQIDCHASIEALSRLMLRVAPSQKRVCHWSSYRRSGLMHLYKRFLRDPQDLTLCHLRTVLPTEATPRWSRLLPSIRPGPAHALILHRTLLGLGSHRRRPSAAQRGSTDNEHAY